MAELQRGKANAEAASDIARGAASQAQRAVERAQAECGMQKAKATGLDAELKRTSEVLQEERRTVAMKARATFRKGMGWGVDGEKEGYCCMSEGLQGHSDYQLSSYYCYVVRGKLY